MKQLKRLTRNQKIIMTKLGLEPNKYGLILEDKESFVVGVKGFPSVTTKIRYKSSTSGEIVED